MTQPATFNDFLGNSTAIEHLRMAIAAGHMRMRSEWEAPRTHLTHAMVGDNFEITHGIVYASREFKFAAEQAARHKGESQL